MNHSINWKKAIVAGIAGTLLFDLFGLAVGSLLRHWVYAIPFIFIIDRQKKQAAVK